MKTQLQVFAMVFSASLIVGVYGAEDEGLSIQNKENAASKNAASQPAQESQTQQTADTATPQAVPQLLARARDGKEPAQRTEALQRLKELPAKSVTPPISSQLFKNAVDDADEDVRKSAAEAIQKLDDKEAKKFLFAAAVHPKIDEKRRKHAAEAIRRVDDPAVIAALVTMVTYDVRTGTAMENVPQRFATISNPAIPITLPIELPDLELRSVSTSLAVYGIIALKEIARRDLGNDPKAWEKWFGEWKQVREARLAQEARK